jgi:hypothetical protein
MLAAIEALDRGIRDPMLEAAERTAGRPIDPPRVWEARALLVVALEFHRAMGEPAKIAADAVVRDFGRTAFLSRGSALRQWRKDFQERDRVPSDGQHWEIYHTARVQLVPLKGLRGPEREDRLRAGYKALIRLALARWPAERRGA